MAAPKGTSAATRRRVDHRVRVGRIRSARMKARIVEAALPVFAEKGPDAPVIEDFVRAAGIARGTFYNHFATVADLLDATSRWTTETIVASIAEQVAAIDDPLLRFGSGVRLFLHRACDDLPWCRFVARTWRLGRLEAPRRDLAQGWAAGAFRVPDVEVALDVVVGAVRQAMLRIGSGKTPGRYVDRVVGLILQALGVDPGRIADVVGAALPPPVSAPARTVHSKRGRHDAGGDDDERSRRT